MAITFYWGSGSPYSWRVHLALEHKGLQYESQLLHFDKQEHQSPQMLKMNPRGRVPVLKDGDYVVFESVAVLYYLDLKYPSLWYRRSSARYLPIKSPPIATI
jgi:glutathione S-transferase